MCEIASQIYTCVHFLSVEYKYINIFSINNVYICIYIYMYDYRCYFAIFFTWEWFLCRWGKLFSSVWMTHSPAGRALRVDQPHAMRRGREKKVRWRNRCPKLGEAMSTINCDCSIWICMQIFTHTYNIYIYNFENIHIDTIPLYFHVFRKNYKGTYSYI